MRHLAPVIASLMLVPAAVFAQPIAPAGEPTQEQPQPPPAATTPQSVTPAEASEQLSPVPRPPAAPPAWRPVDSEVPPAHEPDDERVGDGTRLFLQIQSNSRVGDLAAGGLGGGPGGGFDFEAGSLGGVPDALVGLRVGRLTFALGLTFSQISSSTQGFDSCGLSTMPESLENTQTLLGVIPTVRYDALTTADGRGRFEVGANIPLLLSSRSQEQFDVCRDFTRPAPIITEEASDGIYGLAALIAGRYHVWPALAVGAELGFSYLVFDFDDDPDTEIDEPSVTTLGFHTGLTLAIEVPL